ncbi:MAG TPA: 5'-nucleotidase, partial [Polyangiaceae bacterium]|nr:5'-nucleotidase [Polyangiaceae bacterium]
SRLIAPYLRSAHDKRAQSLGPQVKGLLTPEHDVESALGNLFADVTLEAVPGADVAVLNGGSLRAAIPEGPLTYGALYEAMPFDNRLASIRLQAKDLIHVLEHHLAHDHHGIVSIAGLSLEARCERGSLQVRLRRHNGKLLGPNEVLTVATSDYLATGGDQLFTPAALEHDRIQSDLGVSLREAMALRLSQRASVDPKALLDSQRPRLKLPAGRPLTCN